MSENGEESETDAVPRGILTDADREFLRGERELSESAARNARQRIRERVRTGLSDFQMLWNLLPERDLEQIFFPDDSEERQHIRSQSHHALAFLLLGLWYNQDPHPDRIEAAIEQALFAGGRVSDAEVRLKTERVPDGDLLIAKMGHHGDRIDELRNRISEEDYGEKGEQALREELQREKKFQYYLFEKALVDPSVDSEKLSSTSLLGSEIDVPPEDIEQNQQVWEDSPLVRWSLPILVDVSYTPDEPKPE